MLIQIENVSKYFGENLVFSQVSGTVNRGDRIGLIGVNGAGKSTLLSLICGELEPDEGAVSVGENARIGYLKQNSGLESGNTIFEEMQSVFAPLLEAQRRMQELSRRMQGASGQEYQELSQQFSQLQSYFETNEGYQIEVKINTILSGMNFSLEDKAKPVDCMSGGEKTRLALCKMLLTEPDVLILDEPTNHLDFSSLMWLEEYLASYKGALVVVSHDRYFLDQTVDRIWEMEAGRMSVFKGNYSKYGVLKEELVARREKEYALQQEEIAKLEDYVARNMVRASTSKMARSRLHALDKIERVERIRPQPRVQLSFPVDSDPIKSVLSVEGMELAVGFGEERHTLFSGVDFEMARGEKIALIGDNGVGKTTFLKAVLGLIPHKGRVTWGRGVRQGYYQQDDSQLPQNKTVLDALWDEHRGLYEQKIRDTLGLVLLRGEDVYKQVKVLSGGEKARLKFAFLMLRRANVLILDEPTNHLDLATREVLDKSLMEYQGTILAVSHDRYLLNRFPTKVAEMTREGIRLYPGRFDDYLAAKRREEALSPVPAAPAPEREPSASAEGYYRSKKQRSEDAARKRRIAQLEEEVAALEEEIARLEEQIASPEAQEDYKELQQMCLRLEENKNLLTEKMENWLELQEN